jgi:hypothetical protein
MLEMVRARRRMEVRGWRRIRTARLAAELDCYVGGEVWIVGIALFVPWGIGCYGVEGGVEGRV